MFQRNFKKIGLCFGGSVMFFFAFLVILSSTSGNTFAELSINEQMSLRAGACHVICNNNVRGCSENVMCSAENELGCEFGTRICTDVTMRGGCGPLFVGPGPQNCGWYDPTVCSPAKYMNGSCNYASGYCQVYENELGTCGDGAGGEKEVQFCYTY